MSIDGFGEVRDTFRPKLANIWAGVILGLGLIAGGISAALLLALREDPKPLQTTADRVAKFGFILAFAVGAPAGGVVLLLFVKDLVGHSVSVFDSGFSYVDHGATEIVPWTEVEKITEVFTHERLQVLKIPGAAITRIDRSFVVRRKDGKEFRFTANSIDSIQRFGAVLDAAREQFEIPWEEVEQ